MPKLTTPNSSKAALKVGKTFKPSAWLVFDAIALVVIVGVLALRFTRASGQNTFSRTPQQMSKGTLSRSVASGTFRHIVADGVHAETGADVSTAEMAASTRVCASMHVNSPNTFIDIQVNGHFANQFVEKPGEATICAALDNDAQAGTVYAGTSGDASVYNIYGEK